MDYRAHPAHQLISIGLVFVAAGLCIVFPTWQMVVFLFVTSVAALITSWWMATIAKIQAEEEYWDSVGKAIELLRNSEPEIWEALGFTQPHSHASIEIHHKEREGDHDNPYHTTSYANVPVSPAVLETFANGILSGRKKLSELSWNGIIGGPTYRQFQDWMEDKGVIARVNPQAPTQGYILTESGETWLLQHVSPSIFGKGGSGYTRVIPIRSDAEVVATPPPHRKQTPP